MRIAFEFCLPTAAKVVPVGADWIQEIKYDGYRLRVDRNGKSVRLFSRNGHDWTRRFPWIVEAALKNREQQFVIDGEAVVLGVDGISDLNALHSRKHDHEVQVYAFDILALGGEDLRPLPLTLRKTNLARLLRGRPDGMFVAPFEAAEIGEAPFGAACRMGLEDLVSKRRDRRYGAALDRLIHLALMALGNRNTIGNREIPDQGGLESQIAVGGEGSRYIGLRNCSSRGARTRTTAYVRERSMALRSDGSARSSSISSATFMAPLTTRSGHPARRRTCESAYRAARVRVLLRRRSSGLLCTPGSALIGTAT
ncbi:ATP-dependent DNA ligase [Bradyrhizobium japonicum]|uniref:ATP-dependent DNA ligase n=1 Tax=Bradyrhizobium japonicum TaxID=375 RepID=UPI0027145849|nr:hypothetical protein [Bradyrhizobium japonicum]WLB24069.1 hypothetical protein QIH95_49920 [Bradyrhizobium japonicum]